MSITVPANLRYTTSHIWIHLDNQNIATIGLTDFAQKQLGEITFVDLPQLGQTLSENENFGCVESMKAATDLFCPIRGVVYQLNEALALTPNLINSDPYDKGWLFRLHSVSSEDLHHVLTAEEYAQRI